LHSNSNNDLKKRIVEIISQEKPQSVKQLAVMSMEILELPERKILEVVLQLQAEGLIKLKDPLIEVGDGYSSIASDRTLWYKFTIAVGAIAVIMAFVIPANLYPWAYLRNFFGVIFVLFLPGFTFMKALFPSYLTSTEFSMDLETIERIALSVGLSIALVSIMSLLLYYSPLGLSLPAIVVTLFAITCSLSIVGVLRGSNKIKTLMI
jgi:hypothetical protein